MILRDKMWQSADAFGFSFQTKISVKCLYRFVQLSFGLEDILYFVTPIDYEFEQLLVIYLNLKRVTKQCGPT